MANVSVILLHLDTLGIAMNSLNNAELGELLRLIYAYHTNGTCEPESEKVQLMFPFFKNGFDRDHAKYDEISERRRYAAQKRWEKKEEVEEIVSEPIQVVEIVQPPTKPKSAHHADYDWIDPDFHDTFQSFLEYKRKEKKGTYKAESSVRTAYNHLLELSNHDPTIAEQIVQQTIANGYMGLVPLKNNNRNEYATVYERHVESKQQLANDLSEYYRIKEERERAAAEGTGTSGFVPPSLLD